jgi:cytochrome c-type biogenesis protein
LETSALIIISAGFLSFFSPCILPIIPAYLSYISGVNIKETSKSRFKLLFHTLFFVLGFSTAFVLLQILVNFFANFTLNYIKTDIVQIILGAIVIVFGLSISGILKFKFLTQEKKIKSKIKPGKFTASYLLGFIFGFGWTPCMGPILMGVIAYTLPESTLKGIYYMLLYSISLSIPFIILSLLFEYFSKFLAKLEKYSKYIQAVSGIILIILGILIMFDKLNILTNINI